MHMERPTPHPEPRIISQALRDVESQLAFADTREGRFTERQRNAFHSLLDRNAPSLFEAVSAAAKRKERSVHVSQIPSFDHEVDAIFNSSMGIYDASLLTDWLRCRDLGHVFRANSLLLEW